MFAKVTSNQFDRERGRLFYRNFISPEVVASTHVQVKEQIEKNTDSIKTKHTQTVDREKRVNTVLNTIAQIVRQSV